MVPEDLRVPRAGRTLREFERERRSSSPSEVEVEVWLDSALDLIDFVLTEGSASEGTTFASVVEAEVMASEEAIAEGMSVRKCLKEV